MKIDLHIDELVLDPGLARRPELLERGLRDELARLLAERGLDASWQGSQSRPQLTLPALSLPHPGGLSGEQIAAAVHAALQAPPNEARGTR